MDTSILKRLITGLSLVSTLAYAGPDDILLTQRNSLDTGNIQRVTAHPTGGPGLLRYNLATLLPDWVELSSPLQFNGATLEIVWPNADWNSVSGNSQILNKPTFATIAFTGLAADITNSTSVGRAVLTAATQADARTAIGVVNPVARSFNYTTRSLNTCFQVSSTRDAFVSYAVDIGTSLSLLAGQQGTVYMRTYTNSSCTTGTQEVTRFVNGQTGTLTIGLALQQNVTGTLAGIIPAGLWVQLVTENNTGTPTFTARPGQETLL
jgi:hypothetical protein